MPGPLFASLPPTAADAVEVSGVDGVALVLYRLRESRESGPAILFGHANGLAAGSYLPLLRRLAERAQVFAFDCRGHGGAGVPLPEPGGPTLGELYALDKAAGDLAAVAEAVAARTGGAPLHYAAHSQSGVNALRLAGVLGQHPFAAMTLFEPPVMPAPGIGCRALAEKTQPAMAANARRRRARWPGPDALAASLGRKPAFAACGAESLAAHARATLRPIRPGEDGGPGEGDYTLCCPPEVEGALFDSLIDATTFSGLTAVRAPVTLVGSDPATAPPDAWVARAVVDLAARIPDCRTVILPEVSHMMPLENPAACAALVLDTRATRGAAAARPR